MKKLVAAIIVVAIVLTGSTISFADEYYGYVAVNTTTYDAFYNDVYGN